MNSRNYQEILNRSLVKSSIEKLKELLKTDPSNLKQDTKYYKNIFWSIGHFPTVEDLIPINLFLERLGAKQVSNDEESVRYRFFFHEEISLHIILYKIINGININAHIDIGIHDKVVYNTLSSTILIELSSFLQLISSNYQIVKIRGKESKILNASQMGLENKEIIQENVRTCFSKINSTAILKAVKRSIDQNHLINREQFIGIIESEFLHNSILSLENPDISKKFNLILAKKINEMLKEVKRIYKNRITRTKVLEAKMKKDEIVEFEWRRSRNEIPSSLRRAIKKRLKFGIAKNKFVGEWVPKSLRKEGVIELTYQVIEDDIIVNGLKSISTKAFKLKDKRY